MILIIYDEKRINEQNVLPVDGRQGQNTGMMQQFHLVMPDFLPEKQTETACIQKWKVYLTYPASVCYTWIMESILSMERETE